MERNRPTVTWSKQIQNHKRLLDEECSQFLIVWFLLNTNLSQLPLFLLLRVWQRVQCFFSRPEQGASASEIGTASHSNSVDHSH